MSVALALAVAAAREAGALLRARGSAATQVRADEAKDLKLGADVLAETVVLDRLRASSPHPILSEEAGADPGFSREGWHWVVDPLDGTLNYGRELPLSCVSLALWKGDAPVLGVVYDFTRDEMFTGETGNGAACNGVAIRTSAILEPGKAVLATGFPSGRDYGDASLAAFCRHVQQFKKVRLLGSAALSLAWLAAGRLDAYTEEDIWFWDVAAGLALVGAAGGRFECRPGRSRHQFRVAAWAPALQWTPEAASSSGAPSGSARP